MIVPVGFPPSVDHPVPSSPAEEGTSDTLTGVAPAEAPELASPTVSAGKNLGPASSTVVGRQTHSNSEPSGPLDFLAHGAINQRGHSQQVR